MFTGIIPPLMTVVFGGKEFRSVFVRKAKDYTASPEYVNLNQPVRSRGKKTMGKELQGFLFTSMDSSSEDDDRTNYKPSRRNALQKTHSVESSPSSEDESSSPIPESTFPVYDSNYSANSRRRFSKMAGRTMKTVLGTLSPKISKKKYAVSVCSQEPVWPNSMNTFSRGITTSKEQHTMSPPQEQSLASLRIQLDGEERELLRQAAANAVVFTGELLQFDTPSPPTSLPASGVLMPSFSDSYLYYPPCQKCMTFINQGLNTEHHECEATSWRSAAAEGTLCNDATRIADNHLVLTEGPPEDDFFA